MSTELRAALREAVAGATSYDVDPDALIRAGARRRRRRAGAMVGASALAAATVVVTVVLSGHERPEPDPAPAEIVRVDLDDAVAADLDVVARTRTTWRDAGMNSLEYDRLTGITADGLVLRTRYTNDHGFPELGLLDPRTGATDWLPPSPAPMYEPISLDLATDRLVLFQAEGNGHSLSVFDRVDRTWKRDSVAIPHGIEVHVPPRVILGPNDRVYVGSTMEGESGPIHWWSAPVRGGGKARPEPALEGATVAWGGGALVTADPAGRVVVSDPSGVDVVADSRPAACDPPEDLPDSPVTVAIAGDLPVVTYTCETGIPDVLGSHTVVYAQDGRHTVEVADASVLAADDTHVVIGESGRPGDVGRPGGASTYVLDLDDLAVPTIRRVGPGPHEPHVALVDGLLLWNAPGPGDDNDVYDVTWSVARID